MPCPPGKHCVENLLERTAACGDGCRRRPPHPLAERGPCGSGSFLPAGSQTPLRGPAPPLPAGSPVSSRSRDPALSPGGLGRGSAPPSRRRRPPRRSPPSPPSAPRTPPAAATRVVGVRLGRAYSQPCRLQAARYHLFHTPSVLKPPAPARTPLRRRGTRAASTCLGGRETQRRGTQASGTRQKCVTTRVD